MIIIILMIMLILLMVCLPSLLFIWCMWQFCTVHSMLFPSHSLSDSHSSTPLLLTRLFQSFSSHFPSLTVLTVQLGLKEDLEEYMIPVVIKAFQRGDMDVLRSTCGGEALAGVSAAIKERMTRGHLHAEGLLDLHHVTISDPKFESGTPLMNVTFVVQQIHCIRNKKGEIVEGGESEIYNVYYQWMLRREFGNPDSDWRIVKFGFQQVLTLV